MSEQDDPKAAEAGRAADDLNRSLRRCSSMVRDYRSRLIAANSNDAGSILSTAADNDPQQQQESHDNRERTG